MLLHIIFYLFTIIILLIYLLYIYYIYVVSFAKYKLLLLYIKIYLYINKNTLKIILFLDKGSERRWSLCKYISFKETPLKYFQMAKWFVFVYFVNFYLNETFIPNTYPKCYKIFIGFNMRIDQFLLQINKISRNIY